MLHARVYTQEQLLPVEDYEGGDIRPGGEKWERFQWILSRQRRPEEDTKKREEALDIPPVHLHVAQENVLHGMEKNRNPAFSGLFFRQVGSSISIADQIPNQCGTTHQVVRKQLKDCSFPPRHSNEQQGQGEANQGEEQRLFGGNSKNKLD